MFQKTSFSEGANVNVERRIESTTSVHDVNASKTQPVQ